MSDYVPPEELIGAILRDPLPFDPQVVQRVSEGGLDTTDLLLLSEVFEGEKVYLHAWLCRPTSSDTAVPPLLVIPGGRGYFDAELPAWIAKKAKAAVLTVDWIGSGRSSSIAGLDPWKNAIRFEGDYRTSYQFHNLRAFVRATNFLLSQPFVDSERLIGLGSSWGGFYLWLLSGLDPRFRHIFVTFGGGFVDIECSQVWESAFASMTPEKAEEWLRAFDPGRRAHLIDANVYFQQATNDKFYGLLASMKTYHRVRTAKRLLLVRNQDHFTVPYRAHDVEMARAVIEGTVEQEFPDVHDVRWLPRTNLVEVRARAPGRQRVSVVYSCGRYTKSFGRYWREAPAEPRGGRYVAEIPVVDVEREIWLYGHTVVGDPPRGASSPLLRVVPAELGLERPTAEFDPSFDFSSDSFWNLPIGDRQHPAMRLVEEDGLTALAMQFDGEASRRGVAFCLEGDLIAKHGYNGIEVMVRVARAGDVRGLKLCLVSDFHALSEQVYVLDLEEIGGEFTSWRTVQAPFSSFEPHVHRKYDFYNPQLRAMDVSRLCGVGLFHANRRYRGEALLARIRVIRIEGAVEATRPAEEAEVWPLRTAWLNEPDPLAATGQGAAAGTEERRLDGPVGTDLPQSPPAEPAPERPSNLDLYDLYVPTDLPADQLRERLRRWEPWRHEVVFGNGVRTSELATVEPFVPHPLAKWHFFKDLLPEPALRGRRALDVGSNIGHYSLFLRSRYDMDVVGLELNPRNVAVARFLLDLTGLDRVDFREADAERFRDSGRFDLILHLGTLDHMKNPFLALENAAAMLAPDGYLALELQTYKDANDETLCKFVDAHAGSPSCWWFLGKDALLAMLAECGFARIEVVAEWSSPELIGESMRRLHLLARGS